MGFFGKLGKKIDKFFDKTEAKIEKNIDKFVENHAHHGSDSSHSVSKRSVDVSDDIRTPPTPGTATAITEAADGQSPLVGCICEPDHHAISL